jgi:tetratricopeptide (TPR) repeat protein
MIRHALGSVFIFLSFLVPLSEAAGQTLGEPPPATSSGSAPTSAPAAPAEPSIRDRDNAKRHYEQGVVLFNNGDYQAALAEFEASYLFYPTPYTLENIGLAQKTLYRYPEAVASLERYLEKAKKLPPENIAQTRALIDEMRARLAEVKFTITPDGTTVVIDGRSVGQSPLAPLTLVAGRHELELNAPEHEPLRREILVIAGRPLELTLPLKPIPRTGQLRITALPANALIRVDGKFHGTGNIEVELAAGGHTLEVSAPGYRTERSEVAIAAGQRRSLNSWLEALPMRVPLHRRWWLWTAVAAVAGGTATAIAVPLSTGPLPPVGGSVGKAEVE